MRRDQESFLVALERMPHTVCHLDLHPANLFGRDDETVLIDWSFVGLGSIGEDAVNLVPDAVLDFHVPPEEVADLYDLVLGGYLEGCGTQGGPGRKRPLIWPCEPPSPPSTPGSLPPCCALLSTSGPR
jgi:hypothetical protein